MTQVQQTVLSYAEQPFYFGDTVPSVGVLSDSPYNIDSAENATGVFTPDLSDFGRFNVVSGVETFLLVINFGFHWASYTAAPRTVALVGASLMTYEDDGGSPDLTTGQPEDITCVIDDGMEDYRRYNSFAHSSSNFIRSAGGELPGIISGGNTNIVFPGITQRFFNSLAFVFIRSPANVAARPHAVLVIGHAFIGLDISVALDPDTFSWGLSVNNNKFAARDLGKLNSEGVIVRRCSGDILDITNNQFTGAEVDSVETDGSGGIYAPYPVIIPESNYFDMIKSSNSYPVLFCPYTHKVEVESASYSGPAGAVDDYSLSARQNFFSIYGFLEQGIEIRNREFRDGLNSKYSARFSIEETR